MTATLPALSREYLRVDVYAEGTDAATLNTLPVAFAFMPTKTAIPDEDDWVAGDWEPGKSVARCLVGPGGATLLSAGTTYTAWLRVDGAVERPVRQTGPVKVI